MIEPGKPTPVTNSHHDPRIRRLELLISALLRIGVITSVSLIVVGTIATFRQHPAYLSSAAALQELVGPKAAFPHSIDGLLAGLHQLRGEAIVAMGLLVLMATPVMRVAVSMLMFIWQRDQIYALITGAVLCLLVLSLLLGSAK
jgi:uncharacterized membrane protein